MEMLTTPVPVTSVGAGPISSALSSLGTSPHVVGAAWMVSSVVFTTYSTTRFLQFVFVDDRAALKRRMKETHLPSNPSSFIKRFLSLPPPSMLTLWRFLGSLLLGLLLHPDVNVIARLKQTVDLIPLVGLPALFLFVANLSNSIALDRIGISLTYTSKCAIPLFTVILSILLDGTGTLPNVFSLASLIPIAVGIAAASWNSPTFELWGFIAAIVSTTSQSALNVTSKRAIAKAGVSGPTAQRSMAAVGLLIAMFVNLAQVLRHSYNEKLAEFRARPPFWLTAMAVTAYHVEYSLSFAFVKLVQPITYGTCDAIRRLCIIIAGRQFFGGKKMTKTNIAGVALALFGALAYSITSALQ